MDPTALQDAVPDLRPRSYQVEMFQESVKANIICCMDTGSGKTHVAMMRVNHELQRRKRHRMAWVLCPSVALCDQQYRTFKKFLPQYQHRMLSGNDGVDKWTTQKIWDAALLQIDVVCATPQVLYDALSHGFVKLGDICLMVFDEAHHCSRNSPMSLIMLSFYHAAPTESRPCILGLTASPVTKATQEKIDSLEATMASKVMAPRLQKQDLLMHVHRPLITRVGFLRPDHSQEDSGSTMMKSLHHEFITYDMTQDPYVRELMSLSTADAFSKLRKIMVNRKTFVHQQLKTLHTRATELDQNLGPSSVDWFISQCFLKLKNFMRRSSLSFEGWTSPEQKHIFDLLQRVAGIDDSSANFTSFHCNSEKVDQLIQILDAVDTTNFRGIIFVRQRAVVASLAALLSSHESTSRRFRVGTFVGASSNYAQRKSVADLADLKGQKALLADFRQGGVNLMISTNVLEEGIDVPACNVVICFDPSENYISYVQRRGRARQQSSNLYVFIPETDIGSINRFATIEHELELLYAQEQREIAEELQNEGMDEDDGREIRLPTGALLNLANALPHLHHFCSILSKSYTDIRPEYTITESDHLRLRRATVTLPPSVDQSLRTIEGTGYWYSDRAARRDVAYEACKALYQAGLLNDHFLPILSFDVDGLEDNQRTAVQFHGEVEDQKDILAGMAVSWQHFESQPVTLFNTTVELSTPGRDPVRFRLLWRQPMDYEIQTKLFWSRERHYHARIIHRETCHIDVSTLNKVREATHVLISSAFKRRMQVDPPRLDFVVLVAPDIAFDDLDDWLSLNTGVIEASEFTRMDGIDAGIVRDNSWHAATYLFICFEQAIPDSRGSSNTFREPSSEEEFCVTVSPFPKRADFLHPVANTENPAYSRVRRLPARCCTIDKLPSSHAIAVLLIPSVINECLDGLLARSLNDELRRHVYSELPLEHVLSAICHSSGGRQANYERLETLGDCVLKFCVSLLLMTQHLHWPEAYLTRKKGDLVSNETLMAASVQRGIPQYIITRPFTGYKWRPQYISDHITGDDTPKRRQMSKKIPADVVEALIGAAFLSQRTQPTRNLVPIAARKDETQSFQAALDLIIFFLPTLHKDTSTLPNIDRLISTLRDFHTTTQSTESYNWLNRPEKLLGYTFIHRRLLSEALTHASCRVKLSHGSYERLEFLGDAILDAIITPLLFHHISSSGQRLPHHKMHTLRTALVNGDLLAFLCLSLQGSPSTPSPSPFSYSPPNLTNPSYPSFMQYDTSQPALATAREAAQTRHVALRESIIAALQVGRRYPWTLLARCRAPKFLSDLIESALGAIYLDSSGDLDACRMFLQKLGLLQIARRLLADEVDCLHPKEVVGHLAKSSRLTYRTVEVAGGDDDDDDQPFHAPEEVCKRVELLVEDIVVASVDGAPGEGREVVEVRAAEKAVGNAQRWEEVYAKVAAAAAAEESQSEPGTEDTKNEAAS